MLHCRLQRTPAAKKGKEVEPQTNAKVPPFDSAIIVVSGESVCCLQHVTRIQRRFRVHQRPTAMWKQRPLIYT